MHFTIAAEPEIGGVVEDPEIIHVDGSDKSAAYNETLTQCIIEAFLYLEFPPPQGGGILIVTYPFTFSPPGADTENTAP